MAKTLEEQIDSLKRKNEKLVKIDIPQAEKEFETVKGYKGSSDRKLLQNYLFAKLKLASLKNDLANNNIDITILEDRLKQMANQQQEQEL